jgi:AcrR family transcriptional regulator
VSSTATAALEHEQSDGRNLRRTQSRERAVDAVLDLIEDGVAWPTAQQIAERSGISIRTVFRLTEDVESLLASAVQRQAERVAPLYVTLPTEGSTATRIRALVKSRARIFETIAPVRRVGEQLALRSPHVAQGLDWHHRLLRVQVATLFEPELSDRRGVAAEDTLNAADVVAGWETWEQLRRLKGLTEHEAARVVRRLLESVFADHPA